MFLELQRHNPFGDNPEKQTPGKTLYEVQFQRLNGTTKKQNQFVQAK